MTTEETTEENYKLLLLTCYYYSLFDDINYYLVVINRYPLCQYVLCSVLIHLLLTIVNILYLWGKGGGGLLAPPNWPVTPRQ